MTTIETSLRLQHDCPFNELSKRHPSLVISHWCNYETDVVEVSGDGDVLPKELEQEMSALAEMMGTKVLRMSLSGRHSQMMVQHCGCCAIPAPVGPEFEKHNCLELQPAVYSGGWEYYRLVAFNKEDLRRLFESLGKFCNLEVLSRRSVAAGAVKDAVMVSPRALFGGLTRKQMRALVYAVENGYYQVPKKITTDEMARRLKQPRTTYEEHLRKAESKVLRSVLPFVNLGPG